MLPTSKQDIVIEQASTTNAATATGAIDTLGFDFMSLDVIMATSNNVTNNPTVFKLAESDDATAYTDITKFVGDGVGGWTIPASVTSGEWSVKFNVDLRGLDRYLKLSISPLTTQVITAIANLFRAAKLPTNSTDAGVKALIEG